MNAPDPLRNLKDPLHKAGPEAGKELFRQLGKVCHGFNNDAVIDAATNLLINIVRQSSPTWSKAEQLFDERFGRGKTVLRDHYDANGKRRNVFPFHQYIHMDFFKDKGN